MGGWPECWPPPEHWLQPGRRPWSPCWAIRSPPATVFPPPPPEFKDGTFGDRYDATAAAISEIAAGRRAVLDLATRWRADGPTVAAAYYVDSIHQSLAGQILMASLARDVVLKAVATP